MNGWQILGVVLLSLTAGPLMLYVVFMAIAMYVLLWKHETGVTLLAHILLGGIIGGLFLLMT